MNRKTALILSLLFILGSSSIVFAQGSFCPPNIDFESGTFTNWNCFRGKVGNPGGIGACVAPPAFGTNFTLTACAPAPTLHSIVTGPPTDVYGSFPVVAPGGGTYSLKLGKDTDMYNADRVITWIHIPAGTTRYSLIYHYAVVVENPSGHCFANQPRMMAEAFDSLSGKDLPCDSFSYVGDGTVPGFTASPVESIYPGNGFDVLYKPWTTGNFKFDGENGKTVGIQFTVGGCTQSGHFGYGYADMSCGLFAISTLVCGATFVTLSAPPGYNAYRWTDSTTFGITYGITQTCTAPPPTSPTTYAVICTPYTGYGCPDTLYTHVTPTSLSLSPSPDTAICIGGSATLTTGASDVPAGTPFTYSWAPAAGLSCTGCANPVATPTVTTSYTVTVTNAVGCPQTHIFNVTVYPIPAAITGTRIVCASGGTTTLFDVTPGGHWSSSSTAVASIGATTGTVTGGGVLVPTVVTMTYSFGAGSICGVSTTVTVNPLPPNILGPTAVCIGSTISLTDPTPGGTWSSSISGVATVGSGTGVVLGVGSGTATIRYTLPTTGCSALSAVTVVSTPSPITGPAAICAGATAFYFDGGGGTWALTNTTIATIGSGTGTIRTIGPGVDTIIYTQSSGCFVTKSITINPQPSPIAGPTSVCQGSNISLTDPSLFGFWTSSFPSIATVGVFTGTVGGVLISGSVSPAIDTISYTFTTTGCSISMLLTVNPLPLPPAGPSTICLGSSATYIDLGGGTWATTDPGVATTAPPTSGIVWGASVGPTNVVYTLPTGCSISIPISITPLPLGITGPTTVCVGGTVTLHDATIGGAWTSGNTSIATVDGAGLGNITGAGIGIVNISYTAAFPSTCATYITMTVVPTPAAIVGPVGVCSGSSVLYTDVSPGGTWTSSSPTVASVGSSTGLVTGGATTGPVTISYTTPGGCSRSLVISVFALPGAISSGSGHVCAGSTLALTDGSVGGTWVSSNTAVATVGSTGTGATSLVYGVSSGTANIDYILGSGCFRSVTVTVNSTPGPVTGVASICSGTTTLLGDTTAGGSWSSSNPSVASVGSGTGLVTGGVVGTPSTATITYSLGGTCVATTVVTVNPLPSPISGTASLCVGATTTLTDGGGGTWSSATTSVATVGSTTGSVLVYGAGPGTSVITYTLPGTGCSRSITVTVNALPGPISSLSGPAVVCSGATITLTDGTVGGTWSSTPLSTASIGAGTGVVTGGAIGTVSTATITYKITTTGCSTTSIVTVNPLPRVFSVTGTGGYCPGFPGRPVCLSGSDTGVTYQLYNGASPVGLPLAGTGGTICWGAMPAGIYSVVAGNTSTTCTRAMTGSATITVAPNPAPIGGPSALCVSATIAQTDSVPFGTWSPAIGSVVDISSTGVVTGVARGTGNITYTTPAGCVATKTLTVTLSPGPIIGPPGVCLASCTILTDTVVGGAWSVSNPSVATIGSLTGLICGVGTGSVVVSYSLGSTGCTVTKTMTVTPAPAAIVSPGNVCIGGNISLSDGTPGGTWNDADPVVAGISPTSGATTIVSGLTVGTDTITYTVGGCPRFAVVTVNPLPSVITGPATVCAGSSIPLTDSVPGGVWTSSSGFVASVNSSGVVTGGHVTSVSTATITYSLGTGCTKTKIITVFPIPGPITTTSSPRVCMGSAITLHDTTTGGTWFSFNTSVASISSAGVVTPGLPGTDTITFTVGSGCSVRTVVTVNPLPDSISGAANLCLGVCIGLSDGIAGGTWTSSVPAVATAGVSTGLVCGNSPGTTIITYTLPTGCSVHVNVGVIAPPLGISLAPSVCVGQFVIATDPSPGGHWYSVTPSIATVDSVSGRVTGVSSGTVIISYAFGSGCGIPTTIIVNPLTPIMGDSMVCSGQAITLTNTTEDGIWSSSSPATASVVYSGPTTASVYGGVSGTALITYTLPTGCIASRTVTVNAAPPAITGANHLCLFTSDTLHDVTSGTWGTSDATIAPIDPTGIVFGNAVGVATITFTNSSTSCPATLTVTVNPLPTPVAVPGNVCVGSVVNLTESPAGGTWVSSDGTIATAGLTSGHVGGVSFGTVFITYTLPTGCSNSFSINVDTLPLPITGNLSVCIGGTDALVDLDPVPGGIWSSSNPTRAVVSSSGVVTGLSASVTGVPSTYPVISYTNVSGCSASVVVTVDPLPSTISPSNFTICQGATEVFTDFSAGGTWMSSDITIATIDSVSGHAIGTGPGSSIITYTVGTGCSITTLIYVNPAPDPLTGSPAICFGNIVTLTEPAPVAGGIWSSSNPAVAPVDATGDVTGAALGTADISYTVAGCPATMSVTVNPQPDSITGPMQVCQNSTVTLNDAVTGGTWSSSDNTLASIDLHTGVLTGVSGLSSVDITYSLGAGCTISANVTVNPIPQPITGPLRVCAFKSTVLSELSGGGAWSSDNLSVATVDAGVVYGVTAGTADITYAFSTGCMATVVVTVNAAPSNIIGSPNICFGTPITYIDSITGGIWSSSATSIATIDSIAGIATGITLGGATISYVFGACTVTKAVNVYPLPAVFNVFGGGSYCEGGTGVHIGLDSSVTGVNYILYRGLTATGTFAGSNDSLDFGLQTVGGSYTVIATSTATTCSQVMAGSALITILPSVLPTVNISAAPGDTVCAGTSTTFTGLPGYGGTPTYQWNVNGTSVGAGLTYTFIPANGDVVSVMMTSTGLCAVPAVVSHSVTMTVNPFKHPDVGVSIDPAGNVCQGTLVDLSAVPSFGGTAPVYTWLKNGTVRGSGASYSFIPNNGDSVRCIMASNYQCITGGDTVSSPDMVINVEPTVLPEVSISASPGTSIGRGQFDTLKAIVVNGGVFPTYQWYLNGYPILTATSATYISNTYELSREDSVSCIVTSDAQCKASSYSWVYINASSVGVKQIGGNGSDISVIPNPNKGEFVIKGTLGTTNDQEVSLEITDILGQVVYRNKVTALNGKINENVKLNKNLANGMYMLSLRSDAENKVFHIVIEQ